jgi:hypothetical protein
MMLLVPVELHGKMHSIIFVTCPNYTEIRRIMMNNLNWVQTSDLNLLTCGSDDLTYEENINIIKHVFNFNMRQATCLKDEVLTFQ